MKQRRSIKTLTMKLLVIPDIHENLVFLKYIITHEDLNSFDHVVLLGDYFDPWGVAHPDADNLRKVAETLLGLKQHLGDRLHLLCGNHDLPYYALRPVCGKNSGKPNFVIGQWLRNTTYDRAAIINAIWDESFWKSLKGAALLDGWLFSHAGVHPEWWPKDVSEPLAAYNLFQERWHTAIDNIFVEAIDPIFDAGIARGGEAPYGGPLWLDWDQEFEDALGLPQIVGHTRGAKLRQKGRSFCIDMEQSAYAILENGELKIQVMPDNLLGFDQGISAMLD